MLPLHGQGTAAVKKSLGRHYPLFMIWFQGAMFLVNRRNLGLPSSFFFVEVEALSCVGGRWWYF